MTLMMPPIKPRVINQHLNAVYPALVLLAGMELDLFSYLSETPKGVDRMRKICHSKRQNCSFYALYLCWFARD